MSLAVLFTGLLLNIKLLINKKAILQFQAFTLTLNHHQEQVWTYIYYV